MTQSIRSLLAVPNGLLAATLAASLGACSGTTSPVASNDVRSDSSGDASLLDVGKLPGDVSEEGADVAPGTTDTDAPIPTDDVQVPDDGAVGRCVYLNPFSQGSECKRYTGEDWTAESAAADCAEVLAGTVGTFAAAPCDPTPALGDCAVPGALGYVQTSAGDDASQCTLARLGCETFAKGTFTPSPLCDDGTVTQPDPDPTGPDWGTSPFLQPYEVCTEPLPGEAAGATDGQVCTFMAISACTEPGRRYDDYINCGEVRTQRPYYGYEIPPSAATDDPRLADEAYMGEVAWLKEQVEACACVCCHAEGTAPKGPSGWSIDAGPLWLDTIPNSGLAMLAGLVDSTAFGAFEPSVNNGFSRYETGLPTNDVARMKAFLSGEFARRGFTVEDADQYPPFGGPLYTQSVAELGPCPSGEGVDATGMVTWTGGGARYVYILDVGSKNPGVPPNLDVPAGTRWLWDVGAKDAPVQGPITYGVLPDTAQQRVPAEGAPAPLVPGETYIIYSLFDIGVPLTACTFEAK